MAGMDSHSLLRPLIGITVAFAVAPSARLGGVGSGRVRIGRCEWTIWRGRLSALRRALSSASPGVAYGHRLAGTQAICTIHHYFGSRRWPAIENRVFALCKSHFDWLHLRCLTAFAIAVDDPDE